MSVAADLVVMIERLAQHLPPLRVRALHLPPAEAAGAKSGEFCALELDDGSLGLSYVLLDDTLARLVASSDSDGLVGAEAVAVARGFAGAEGVRRTLGFAAVNALTRSFFGRVGYLPEASADSIGLLDPQPGDHIGMIGFFPPLVKRIVQAGVRLTVVELKPELAGELAGYRVTLDAGELAGCNKVLSTSTVLLNDTLERMLASCRQAGYFAMIGPGAGCLPDPLFARGVTLMGGAWAVDTEGFRTALTAGMPWGRHARKFALRRDDYPGFEALLGRL